MLVNREDGTCRECDGTLEIVDVDDVSMTVCCLECLESYRLEPDSFGDGCVDYYIPFYAQKADEWDQAEKNRIEGGA